MRIKNNDAIILSPLQQALSENVSKNQGDNLLLASYKVDPKTDNNIIKKNEPTRAIWNSNNNNDVLRNATTNCQHRIMIVDDEQDIARLFAIGLEHSGFVVDVFNDPLSA